MTTHPRVTSWPLSRSQQQTEDVDEDVHDVEVLNNHGDDLEAVAIPNGFRQADFTVDSHDHASPPICRSLQHSQPQRGRTPPPRPSSATKPKRPDSFTLQHDGFTGSVSTRISAAESSSSLASSSNVVSTGSSFLPTDAAVITDQRPCNGPIESSHSYQLYPQVPPQPSTAASMTITPIAPADRRYPGACGPTHPYGMYPQNTVPEAEIAHEQLPARPVPVSFPGLSNNYQRRLRSDEEGVTNILGPEGHAEQLPPYTQYPDESSAGTANATGQLVLTGAGGIGLATRNPEFASREDLHSPPSSQSTRSIMSGSSNHQVDTIARGPSEKRTLKKWRLVARRKVCGIIPLWAIIVTSTLLLFFGVLTGLLTALNSKHPPRHHNPPPPAPNKNQTQGIISTNHSITSISQNQSITYNTQSTALDAISLTSLPSGIPTLPTGTFALSISAPSTIQNSCILDTKESVAWSCSIPNGSPATQAQMKISEIPGANSLVENQIIIDYGNFSNYVSYGAQPPMVTQAQVLSLVTDSQDPEKGPAWFFEASYDKIVIVEDLAQPISKRNGIAHSPGFMRKGTIQPGDKPWFCYWNGTQLETFIYINLNSSSGSSSSTSTSTSTTSSRVPMQTPQSTTMTTYPSSFTPPGGGAVGKHWQGQSWQGQFGPGQPQMPAVLANYPKVYKVEERRVSRGSQTINPYCVQHVVNSDGTVAPSMNSSNQPVTISLNESEPLDAVSAVRERVLLDIYGKRDMSPTPGQSQVSCGCVWLAT